MQGPLRADHPSGLNIAEGILEDAVVFRAEKRASGGLKHLFPR
jgi:hypothetical protein